MESSKDTKQPNPTPRKPYERPRVQESATFEHLQLGCGHKTGSPLVACRGSRANS